MTLQTSEKTITQPDDNRGTTQKADKTMTIQFKKFWFSLPLLVSTLAPSGCQSSRDWLADNTGLSSVSKISWLPGRSTKKPSEESASPAEQKADVKMVLACSMEKQGEVDRAIRIYLEVVEKDPKRADAFHRLAVLHDQSGKHEKAAEFYNKSVKLRPNDAETKCDLGYSYYLQQRWEESEKSLREAIALKDRLPRAHNNLGLLLARRGRKQEALWEFKLGGCDEAQGRANLVHALMLENRWEEALQQCELASTCQDASPEVEGRITEMRSLIARAESRGNKSTAPGSTVRQADAPLPEIQPVSFKSPVSAVNFK